MRRIFEFTIPRDGQPGRDVDHLGWVILAETGQKGLATTFHGSEVSLAHDELDAVEQAFASLPDTPASKVLRDGWEEALRLLRE